MAAKTVTKPINVNHDIGMPDGAVAIWGLSAVVTTTTAVAVITNATASTRLYITQIVVTNLTAAELPVILIADDNATPNNMLYLAPGDLSVTHNGSTIIYTPKHPIKLTNAAEGITAEATAATTGDCHVFAQGFLLLE